MLRPVTPRALPRRQVGPGSLSLSSLMHAPDSLHPSCSRVLGEKKITLPRPSPDPRPSPRPRRWRCRHRPATERPRCGHRKPRPPLHRLLLLWRWRRRVHRRGPRLLDGSNQGCQASPDSAVSWGGVLRLAMGDGARLAALTPASVPCRPPWLCAAAPLAVRPRPKPWHPPLCSVQQPSRWDPYSATP
jgi:hypothetical protein